MVFALQPRTVTLNGLVHLTSNATGLLADCQHPHRQARSRLSVRDDNSESHRLTQRDTFTLTRTFAPRADMTTGANLQDLQSDFQTVQLEIVQTNVNSKGASQKYLLTTGTGSEYRTRLDLVPEVDNTFNQPAATTTFTLTSLRQHTLDYFYTLFLPTGYPDSVTPDYTAYQIYDSLQAFASSIAGLLSSRAVLQSLNVVASSTSDSSTKDLPAAGSPEAATYATILSVAQNTISNLTTIFFAAQVAPRINAEVKYYRFLADIANDAAFVLDLLAPSLPTSFTTTTLPALTYIPISPRVIALCTSSGLRAVCGVASSSKSVLSAHFARNNPAQLGDLNAKDGSQETVINLIGMWVGGVVVSRVDAFVATWIWMIGLLITHLSMNYMAVKSVRLRSLNKTRLEGVYAKHDAVGGRVPSVEEIGREESILHSRGWLASRLGLRSRRPIIRLGVPLSEFHQLWMTQNSTRSFDELTTHQKYIVIYSPALRRNTALILLKPGATLQDHLKAYLTALEGLNPSKNGSKTSRQNSLAESSLHHREQFQNRDQLDEYLNTIIVQLQRAGWDLSATTLGDEGYRVSFNDHSLKKNS